jgi:hypothetical protein
MVTPPSSSLTPPTQAAASTTSQPPHMGGREVEEWMRHMEQVHSNAARHNWHAEGKITAKDLKISIGPPLTEDQMRDFQRRMRVATHHK